MTFTFPRQKPRHQLPRPPAPTPASTSPAPSRSIDKPVASSPSSSSSSSSGSEEQGGSEAAESDTDSSSSSSDHENAKDIAKDDDQKPSQNNQAGHFDDVYQLELQVDGWDGDWLDAWRSAACLFDNKPESPLIRRTSWPIFFGRFTRPRRPGTPRDFPYRVSL